MIHISHNDTLFPTAVPIPGLGHFGLRLGRPVRVGQFRRGRDGPLRLPIDGVGLRPLVRLPSDHLLIRHCYVMIMILGTLLTGNLLQNRTGHK